MVRFPSELEQEISGPEMTLPGNMRTYLLRAEAGGTLLGYPYRTLSSSGGETPDGGFSYSAKPRDGPRVLERLSIDGNRIRVEEIVRAWVPAEAEQASRAPAFTPKLLFDVLPDGGFVFTDSTGYAIKFASSDGTIVRVVTRPIKTRTVTEEVRDQYREWRVAQTEREFGFGDLPPELGNQMREALSVDAMLSDAQSYPVYREIPVIDDLGTTWTGGVWVRRTPEDGYPWEDHVVGSVLSGLAFKTSPAPASPIDVIRPYMEIPRDRQAGLHLILNHLICSRHAFVRAWAYNGFGVLAVGNPDFRREVEELFDAAAERETAAVRARIRHARVGLG